MSFCATICCSLTQNFSGVFFFLYLHSGLRQVGAHGQTFPHHHVGVVGFLEGLLQGLQLLGGEGRATAALLSVLGAIAGLKDNVLKCTAVEKQETAPV